MGQTQRTRKIIWRLVAGIITFLVLPLVVFLSYAYHRAYKARVNDVFVTLELLEKSEVFLLDQLLIARFQILDTAAFLLKTQADPSTFSLKEMNEVFAQQPTNEMLFVAKKGDQWICQAASKGNFLGTDYSELVRGSKEVKPGYTLFAGIDPETRVHTLYIGKEVKGGWIFLTYHANRLIQDLSILQNTEIPMSFSLLNSEGMVIATSDPDLIGVLFGPKGVKIKGSTFTYDNVTRIGIKRPIPMTPYSLLFDVNSSYILAPLRRNLVEMVIFFAVIVAFGALAALYLTRRIAKPLDQLSHVMGKVRDGDLSARYEKDRFGYDINEVGLTFNGMLDQLLTQMDERRRAEVQKEALKSELALGQSVQRALLPQSLPDLKGLNVATHFAAAKEVGGDFYDLFRCEDGRLQIVICDVSGKGIFACFYSLILRSYLRGIDGQNIEESILKANRLFTQDSGPSSVFATVWIGWLDLASFDLEYVSLGHNPPLVLRKNGELETLQGEGMALGVTDEIAFSLKTTQLNKGDLFLGYTDGVIDTHNLQDETFGVDRLEAFLKSQQGKMPEDVAGDLLEELALFGQGRPLFDDLTLLSLSRKY